MVQRNHRTLKLPRNLLDDLGIQAPTTSKFHKRSKPEARKEQREAAKLQQKDRATPTRVSKQWSPLTVKQRKNKLHLNTEDTILPKSILKPAMAVTIDPSDRVVSAPSSQPPLKLSKAAKDRLADDDAEIAALERALGVKTTKKLPKSFGDDGLDILLEGLDHASADEQPAEFKRKRGEEEWLRTKRVKAAKPAHGTTSGNTHYGSDADVRHAMSDDDFGYDVIGSEESPHTESAPKTLSGDLSPPEPQQRIRENPYVAPAAEASSTAQSKYVPPSKRDLKTGSMGNVAKLRRQMQGLLNRFSEANLLSIVKDLEVLYRTYPRQDVTTTLIDLLMGLLCDPTTLHDTFIILHAGFIAALYKVVGSELGAQMILSIHDEFIILYRLSTRKEATGKKLTNLTSLLAQLYNFKVIGSSLIYDVVRLLIEELSERNAELLLRIVRNSGNQLRKDDATSLKAINQLLQSAVAKVGLVNVSVRTKFMVETIDSLANKGMKTGKAESLINAEHISRMRITLGSLNEHSIRASEPLNINLKDLQDSNRKGKWWIVGASYQDDNQLRDNVSATQMPPLSSRKALPLQVSGSHDVDIQLVARQLGLNTDVRRCVFQILMCGDDFETACDKLRRLRLNKSQKFEIPRVLTRCSGAEEQYNPYYTLIARRLISREPKLKRAFQYSLWNVFEKLRQEGTNSEESGRTMNGESTGLRGLINHARMFGTLIAEDGISISVLKDLNFANLTNKLQHMAEVLLITIILDSQGRIDTKRNEKTLMEVFLKSKEAPDMVQGLRYFLRRVVSKTDIAGSREKQATVRWGCKVARDALKAISTPIVAKYIES